MQWEEGKRTRQLWYQAASEARFYNMTEFEVALKTDACDNASSPYHPVRKKVTETAQWFALGPFSFSPMLFHAAAKKAF